MRKPNQKRTVVNLCLTAVFSALYVVLSMFLSVKLGNSIEISLSGLPILLSAVMLPFPYALSVAFIGSFVEQLSFGLMPTTILWMLPCLCQSMFGFLIRKKKAYWFIVAELLLTVLNLGVSYADGLILGYSVAYLIPLIPFRFLNGVIRGFISAILLPLIRKAIHYER